MFIAFQLKLDPITGAGAGDAVGSFLKRCPKWNGVNSQNWWAFGKAVSSGDAYANIYEYRCQELIAALQKEEVILE